MKKIYEFLLWNNCSNNCSFCHQRAHERKNDDKILTPEEQIKSLSKCKEFLDTQFENGNHILLVGGEIFDVQNKNVRAVLCELFEYIIHKQLKQEIDLFYINTNLLYENLDCLNKFLQLIQKNTLFDKLKFTTSYDIVGRYCTPERERLFYRNLKKIKDQYPEINIVVNTVLTNEACKRIQNDIFGADYLLEYLKNQNKNNWTIKEWVDYFQVTINTIPYIRLDSERAPEMPTKNTVFNTLLHINKIMPEYLRFYANNIGLRQEKRLYEYNKQNAVYVYCSSDLSDCGHSENFKRCFADSEECFPCVIEKLAQYNL